MGTGGASPLPNANPATPSGGGANTEASNIIVALVGAPEPAPPAPYPRGGGRCSPAKCDGDRFEYAKLDGKVIVSGPLAPAARALSTKGELFIVSGGGMTEAKGDSRDCIVKGLAFRSEPPYWARMVSREVDRNWRLARDDEDDDEAARLDPGRLAGRSSSVPPEADARSFDLYTADGSSSLNCASKLLVDDDVAGLILGVEARVVGVMTPDPGRDISL